MALEPDIIERVQRDFGGEGEQAMELLRASGKTGRVARCIVLASHGSLDTLMDYVQLALSDDRDVIMAGEYDSAQRRVRDLRATFLLDSSETFWLGEVACMMAARGYILTSHTTRAATSPPFAYTADCGEGRAKFVGPEGEIELEKKGRRWSVCADNMHLEGNNLDREFDDESSFRDAVSHYILSRRPRT